MFASIFFLKMLVLSCFNSVFSSVRSVEFHFIFSYLRSVSGCPANKSKNVAQKLDSFGKCTKCVFLVVWEKKSCLHV